MDAELSDDRRAELLRRGFRLEYVTLGWNVVGVAVLAATAIATRSVALGGFGLDSLIEIGASTVVIWELSGTDDSRRPRALRLIAFAFIAMAVYLTAVSAWALAVGHRADPSAAGMVWTGVTALVMFSLAAGKARTGRALDNPVLQAEGRVTFVDAILATSVLVGVSLNSMLSWWWADPLVGFVLVFYAVREARELLSATE